MNPRGANPVVLDLDITSLREVNAQLQVEKADSDDAYFVVRNPKGAHALACGLVSPMLVEIDGNAGYYCAGMNKHASVVINGQAGQGVAENMMSGKVRVCGDASQSAGATAHGGLLIVEGNAAARCGISLKGGDIVVHGNVGHMSMFMAQAGRLVVLGNAGAALGDSIYEARVYVRGEVASLGTDCVVKEMRDEHFTELDKLLSAADCKGASVTDFQRYGSARQLYNFKVENVSAY